MTLGYTLPPESLRIELDELSRVSVELIDAIKTSNVIGEHFPKHQLLEIASALSSLNSGTAEGCRVPLEYARVRLPAIRREYFRTPNSGGDIWPEEIITPVRGMKLDASLGTVIAAVSTTLDEYRQLATATPDSPFKEHVSISVTEPDRAVAIAQSLRLQEYTQNAANIINRVSIEGSSRAEQFSRTLVDVETSNGLAEAEASFSLSVSKWLRPLVTNLRIYPDILKKIGISMQIGVDIAQPLWDRWGDFWSNVENLLFDEIRKTGKAFEELATKLDSRIEAAQSPAKQDIRKEELLEVDERGEIDKWLTSAFESLSETFILWDKDDRLVMWNKPFQAAYDLPDSILVRGAERSSVYAAAKRPLIERRLADPEVSNGSYRMTEIQLWDERWLQISERRTQSGATISIGSDITLLKRHQERLRDSERRLMATIGDLSSAQKKLERQRTELLIQTRKQPDTEK
ncbi:PAS domain-containing protein [Neorhizobium galegae]|nr:PAS domain-containing protein [Neorhizobium galegae]